jgi:hypothetical protein
VTTVVTVTLALCLLMAWFGMRLPVTTFRSALAAPWRVFCLWMKRRRSMQWWRLYVDLSHRAGVEPRHSAELDRLYAAELRWRDRSRWGRS